ncbi:MAG TPA: hypothetical protein VK507_01165, partial [Iamia sp.]|nr:hypothetical protein [Iamia sp.]
MGLLGSSAIVETAIGLALVFFLGAGVCTAVVELVASLFSFRAKLLWRTVARWFGTVDDADARRAISKAASLLQGGVGASDEVATTTADAPPPADAPRPAETPAPTV